MHKVLKYAIYAVISLLGFYAKAQLPFQKTYNSDTAYVDYAKDDIQAIVPTAGGFILAGATQGLANIGEAGLLMHSDSLGNILSTYSYSKGYVTRFKSMAKAADGNLIVTGATAACNVEDCPTRLLIAKIDTLGQPLWAIDVIGGSNDIGYSIKPTADSNFIVCGWYNNLADERGYDMLVLKMNGNGDTLWTRIAGTAENEFIYDAVESPTGSVIATANQNGNIVLLKLNSNGTVAWVKNYGRGAARRVLATNSGYIVAGYKSDGSVFELTDPFVLKVDTNGNPLSYQTIYGADYDYLSDIKMLPDSSLILCGMTLSFAYDVTDLYLIKCTADGTISWARAYGGYEYDEGTTVLPLADNTFLAAGYTASFNSSNGTRYSAWLLHTDSTGATLNCRDHEAFPILINQTVSPVNLPVFSTRKITIAPSNLPVAAYNMNMHYVCPDVDAVAEPILDKVTIYPNPANGVVFVQKPDKIKTYTLQLYNSNGTHLETFNWTGPLTELNLSTYASGLYIIRILDNKGHCIQTQKLSLYH